MDIKISQLPLAEKMLSSDETVCVTQGSTRKIAQKYIMGLIDRNVNQIEFNNQLEPLGIGVTETIYGSIKVEQATVEIGDLLNLTSIFSTRKVSGNITESFAIRVYYSPNQNVGGQASLLGIFNSNTRFGIFKRNVWINSNPGFTLNVLTNQQGILNDEQNIGNTLQNPITKINVVNPSGNWYIIFTIQFGNSATTDYSTFESQLVELKKV